MTPAPVLGSVLFAAVLFASLLVAFLLSGSPVSAQVYDRGENGFWGIYWENDTFYGTDQSYTNGARIVRVSGLDQNEDHWWIPDELVRRVFAPSCDRNPDFCWEWSGGWTVGQQIYTPQDITIPTIVPDDRPYGGWLYVGKVLHLSRPDVPIMADGPTIRAAQHTFEIDVGVTGEPSLADETQTFVHEHIAKGAPEPLGWDGQIEAEPGLVLRYEGRTRALEWVPESVRVFDLVPDWTVTAGNIFTYAGAGATARLGWNLGSDFGPARIVPVAPMMGRQSDFELYAFGGVNGRAVAHNIFLDGGWFGDDPHTVTKEKLVADVEIGAFLRWGRVGVSFRWVRRTPEFLERRIFQEYGAWNVTLLW